MKQLLLKRHLLGSMRSLEKKMKLVFAGFEVHWPHYTHTRTHTQSVAATLQIDATLELRKKLGQVNATRPAIPAPFMYIGNSAPVWPGKILIYNERRRPDHTAGNHFSIFLFLASFASSAAFLSFSACIRMRYTS